MTENKRTSNFSAQDCYLLTQVMGEKCGRFDMSRHQLAKHRFTGGVTSKTKRDLWSEVEAAYNASASEPRLAEKLEKKWDNLVSKHRSLFSDFKRESRMTGGGGRVQPVGFLTEAVMSVIGKESVAVSGTVGAEKDTAFVQFHCTSSSSNNNTRILSTQTEPLCDWDIVGPQGDNTFSISEPPVMAPLTATIIQPINETESSQIGVKRSICSCECHDGLYSLKREKLKLELELIQLKLNKYKQ